jgi:ribonuclease HI
MQSGLHQRRLGLRLLSLPEGDQARDVVGAAPWIGKRLKNALAHKGRTESTVLLEEPEALDAETIQEDAIQEDEKSATAKAGRARPGITMFMDGSRLDSGAARYAVAWQNGSRVGIKTHTVYNQEGYDAECAALARALEEAAKRQTTPERVTIFTDAQAAIRRMVSEDPGPGQMYAIQARRHIAALRRARPGIAIEIRCPAHKGVPGNKKADEWAKLATIRQWTQMASRRSQRPTLQFLRPQAQTEQADSRCGRLALRRSDVLVVVSQRYLFSTTKR